MPEATQFAYSHRELTELMLRDRDIRAGHWMIQVKFGHAAANVGPPTDDPALAAVFGPASISVIIEIGIQRADQPGPLTVDASTLWRKSRAAKARAR